MDWSGKKPDNRGLVMMESVEPDPKQIVSLRSDDDTDDTGKPDITDQDDDHKYFRSTRELVAGGVGGAAGKKVV